MLTEKDLQWIMKEAEESMVQGGNLDTNLASSELRIVAEKLFYLLKYPDMRPIQEKYDALLAT